MKLTLLIVLCCCLLCLAHCTTVPDTKPPFVRSRYSIRWRKTTTTMPQTTTGRPTEVVTTTEHPKVGTSTLSPDYDYYGNGEADNLVHK